MTTFNDIEQICISKNIQLLSKNEDWINNKILSTSYFDIKARICGHEKTIRFNRLKSESGIDYCRPCSSGRYKIQYNVILEDFRKKECILLTTEQEFMDNCMNTTSIYEFTAKCGHKCSLSYKFLKKCALEFRDCKTCITTLNIGDLIEFAKNNAGNYIETKKYSTNYYYSFECKNKHTFKRSQGEISQNIWCRMCDRENTRILINNVEKGDSHELDIYNLIKENCKSIEITGNFGSIYDIIYTLDDNIERGIQVKTLTKNYSRDNLYMTHSHRAKNSIQASYPENTVIIAINSEDKRYFVDMSQNLKSNIGIYFNSNKCKYINNKFTDINLFTEKLLLLMHDSAPISEVVQYSVNVDKEMKCLQRLNDKCNNLNLTYCRNTTNGNGIDIYINNYAVQVKYCEVDNLNNSINFSLKKSGGIKNGKQTSISYDSNDKIDYYVFEYGGENGKYLSHFCILSKEFMIENKFITNNEIIGKVRIGIWKPESTKDKIGTSKYWNKFEQFLNNNK